MVIRTVPLLWHVQKFQFLAKVKATSTGKLLDSLPRNDAVVELCSCEFNVAYFHDMEKKTTNTTTVYSIKPVNVTGIS
jgi:hypothetical protein